MIWVPPIFWTLAFLVTPFIPSMLRLIVARLLFLYGIFGVALLIAQSVLKKRVKELVEKFLRLCDLQPGLDVRHSHDSAFLEPAKNGVVGIGESYVAGMWSPGGATTLEEVLLRIVSAPERTKNDFFNNAYVRLASSWRFLFDFPVEASLQYLKCNTKAPFPADDQVQHKETTILEHFLGSNQLLTCGQWKKNAVDNLEEAENERMEAIAEKLQLKEKGLAVLDLSCGYGRLACFLAKHYGARVTAVDECNEKIFSAKHFAEAQGLEIDQAEFICSDWGSFANRIIVDYDNRNKFDRILALRVVDRLGSLSTADDDGRIQRFFEVASKLLRPGGLLLVHSMTALSLPGVKTDILDAQKWFKMYICSSLDVPSFEKLTRAQHLLGFTVDSVQSKKQDWQMTLAAWKKQLMTKASASCNDSDELFEVTLRKRLERKWGFSLELLSALMEAGKVDAHDIVFRLCK